MADSDTLVWLMAANAVIWFGIGVYVALVAAGQNALKRRLQQLEHLSHDSQA